MDSGLRVKRVYDPPAPDDGYRILVDRLWPRGVSKDRAAIDLWLKDIAPSPGLRKWFGHEPGKFAEFSRQYQAELDGNLAVAQLRQLRRDHQTVTLVYAAKDPRINHAAVLRNYFSATAEP